MRALLLIVPRSLRQHALSTIVTACSVALATGLVMAVFAIMAQTRTAFTGGPVGFDAVLGARGSKLQLVLNTVFHLETSPGNIPWSLYQAIKREPTVRLAIPYAVGDNYWGYRIVGTTAEIFTEFEYQKGRKLTPRGSGRPFDEARREAVVGRVVADRIGLVEGTTFRPFHGLVFNQRDQHEEDYTVVGVLEPTNSPTDRVIFIPIEGVFRMTGHVLRGTGVEYEPQKGEVIPDAHKEVSAVMLKLSSPIAGFRLDGRINRQGKIATLAWPIGASMAELFDKLGWVNDVLALVAVLVCVVAAFAILAALYNTMNERRREFAILRALGATRRTVFAAVVGESGLIALVGALAGYACYAAITAVAAAILRDRVGIVLHVWPPHPILLWMPGAAVVIGALAGVIPAIKAYATDVASSLVPAA